jgi:hypothetical protein
LGLSSFQIKSFLLPDKERSCGALLGKQFFFSNVWSCAACTAIPSSSK